MAVQNRNPELVSLLTPDFLRRIDIRHLWYLTSTYQALPALRGFWPGSGVGATGQLVDQSGLGNHPAPNSNNPPVFGYVTNTYIPLVNFPYDENYNSYFEISDATSSNAYDISGTESYIASGVKGVTYGAWFRPEAAGTGLRGLMYKGTGGASTSFLTAYLLSTDDVRSQFSDGTTSSLVTSTNTVTDDSWNMFVCKYDIASTTNSVFLNGTFTTGTSSITSFNNSASNLTFGNALEGDMSMMFISACVLSDQFITDLYNFGARTFGLT